MKVIQVDLSNSDRNIQDFRSKHFASIADVSINNIKKYHPDLEFELWKVYDPKHWHRSDISSLAKDGIKYRLFPIDFTCL